MVVDNVQQLESIKGEHFFLYPVCLDERLHKQSNPVIAFVIVNIDTKETWTLCNGHPEGIHHSNDLSFLKDHKVYCYDTSILRYAGIDVSNFIDVKLQYYLYTNQGYNVDSLPLINYYTRSFQKCFRINELVSLCKHEEQAQTILEECWVKIPQYGLSFYQEELSPAFHKIEQNGLCINESLFVERFGESTTRKQNLCFTQYNFYTTTGRPSNRFGGINFAALAKDDNTREVFVSRYIDGTLVEMDFNCYHPRLIAQLIDYDFKDANVYEHLAKFYTQTDNPTQTQIEESKEATFRQLYGGIQQQYLRIPFFAKTEKLTRYLWSLMEAKDYIESPISGRRLYSSNFSDLNANVLFNYFVQMYETESNVLILNNLHRKLNNSQIKPILYTYDSILFDVPAGQENHLIHKVLPECIDLTKFPVKIKQGKTYKNLKVLVNSPTTY